jgi:hypothetical protein
MRAESASSSRAAQNGRCEMVVVDSGCGSGVVWGTVFNYGTEQLFRAGKGVLE